jgi:hypothetical protein
LMKLTPYESMNALRRKPNAVLSPRMRSPHVDSRACQ